MVCASLERFKGKTMPSLPVFLVRILRAAARSEGTPPSMCIVIRRPYAELEQEILRAFEGQDDVQIVLDRRRGERRRQPEAVDVDRRRQDRRKPVDEIVEVTFSG
jgi:hypothetical protein